MIGSLRLNAATKSDRNKVIVKEPFVQDSRFGDLLDDVSRARRILMDRAMRPLCITRSQFSVLSTLSHVEDDGMIRADLARLLVMGKVALGGLVHRLEASAHIERRYDTTNRAARRVFVTESGFVTIAKMDKVVLALNARVLSGIYRNDIVTLEIILTRSRQNIRALAS